MKELSIFVDESGDFGETDNKNPYYLLMLVLHDQSKPLSLSKLEWLDEKLRNLFPSGSNTYVHAGPIIRKEKEFNCLELEDRRHIINSLFHFAISSDINYISFIVDKRESNQSPIWLHNQLVKMLNQFIDQNLTLFTSYDKVKLYYDLGQKEITNILNSIFYSRLPNYLLGNTNVHSYRLFQVADLLCTFELLNLKKGLGGFTKSETIFFENSRKFNKNYYKSIKRKKLK